jgi:uncharacterized protein (TIGR02679 family)
VVIIMSKDLIAKNNGLVKLLRAFAEKYHSYKGFGQVTIEVSDDERNSIRGFMGKYAKIPSSGPIHITSSQFQRAIDTSSIKGHTLQSLIEEVLGMELTTKQDKREQIRNRQTNFLQGLRKSASSKSALSILDSLLLDTSESASIMTHYNKDLDEFEKLFPTVIAALEKLPLEEHKRIPVFAASLTGDPHALDAGTPLWTLLFQCMIILLEGERKPKSKMNAEEIANIALMFGLTKDELTNKVTVMGLIGDTSNGPSFKLDGALKERSFIDLSLRDLVKFLSISPAYGKRVYVVENPAVFSAILDEFEGTSNIPTVVCTSGNLRVSAYRLFDLLVKTNDMIEIWYSGDFDPEGLGILSRLSNRYPQKIIPWRYEVADYERSLPRKKVGSGRRLQMMEKVELPQIGRTINAVRKEKRAGYQETLIPLLIEDLKLYVSTME